MTAVFQEPLCCWNRSLHVSVPVFFPFITELSLCFCSVWKTGQAFYCLCDLYGGGLLSFRMADHGCLSHWCQYCLSSCRHGSAALCTVWRRDIRYRQCLAIRFGGDNGRNWSHGSDFLQTLGITVGTFVMIYNILLYIICGFVLKSWILPLYSIVTYAAAWRPSISLWKASTGPNVPLSSQNIRMKYAKRSARPLKAVWHISVPKAATQTATNRWSTLS